MQVIKSVEQIKKLRAGLGKVGFVATMGNLHEGHQSLIEKAASENDHTILSIYVNHAQFNDKKDFANYPRTIDADLALAEKLNVSYLLIPSFEEIYADGYAFRVTENTELSSVLEGEFRAGHFTGMLTVVMKLLLITRPTKSYFGEKDYQQFLLVKAMAAAFFLDTEIIALPTIRNKDGLPLSSRNSRLSSEQLKEAAYFSKLLSDQNISCIDAKHKLIEKGFIVEYLEERWGKRLGAVKFHGVRLIDNYPIL